MVNKFDVILVDLNPTKGHEQKGIRPCIVLQSNLVNNKLGLTIVAPFTSNLFEGPSSLIIEKYGDIGLSEKSKILFHQIKVIDEKRIVKKIGQIKDKSLRIEINNKLSLLFDLDELFA